ncbi:hypothetical protein TNCV_1250481 [Trichonephila clavipes]|nr:hypothetical protein TNCV_1250481 [Trichonephila clavipes]
MVAEWSCHKLVTSVVKSLTRVLVPLKRRRLERLSHDESVEAENSSIGVRLKFGEWGAVPDLIFVTCSSEECLTTQRGSGDPFWT